MHLSDVYGNISQEGLTLAVEALRAGLQALPGTKRNSQQEDAAARMKKALECLRNVQDEITRRANRVH